MRKAMILGTVVLAIAGSSLVYAEQGGQRARPNVEDMRAFAEARLAALKAGLALTRDQERNWPAFEQATRELRKLRIDRIAAIRTAGPVNEPVERMRQRATAMSETGAALKKLADATDPLYKNLDDAQKRRFEMLNRLGRHGREHFRGREGHRPGGWGRESREG